MNVDSRISKKMAAQIVRFERCQMPGAAPTESGLRQFHHFESTGEQPASPDPYFLRLWNGKKWWQWTVKNLAELYGTAEWPGWLQLEHDFKDDPTALIELRGLIGKRQGHIAMQAAGYQGVWDEGWPATNG
jgi:hypothetical protein